MCFFAGNDFLDHLKVVSIHKNGIELLIEKYLEQVKEFKKPLLNNNFELNQKMLLANKNSMPTIYSNINIFIRKEKIYI